MTDNVIFIVGKRGYGKSTLSKRVLSLHTRIVIFDPLREYHNFTVFHSMDDFFDYFASDPKEFTVVCRFDSLDEAERARQYEFAAMACNEIGNLLLVLEECELFITSTNQRSYINYLISMGRHKGVNLLAIGRRPSEIPIKFRANFTSVYAFQVTEPRDLATLQAYGFDIDRVRRLPKFEYEVFGKDILQDEQESNTNRASVDDTMLLRQPGEGRNSPEHGDLQPLQNPVHSPNRTERGNNPGNIL